MNPNPSQLKRVVKINKESLTYCNTDVIKRYAKDFKRSEEYAAEVFASLMIWLYLCEKCAQNKVIPVVTESILQIDNMWHTFILFTRDYSAFCDKYYGYFLHHNPETDASNSKLTQGSTKENLKQFLDIMVAEFGEELAYSWYKDKKFA